MNKCLRTTVSQRLTATDENHRLDPHAHQLLSQRAQPLAGKPTLIEQLSADALGTREVTEACGIKVNHNRSLGALALGDFGHGIVDAWLVKFRQKIQTANRHRIDPLVEYVGDKPAIVYLDRTKPSTAIA
jgi:hypothetical protein